MQEGQLNSGELVKALNEVKMNGNNQKIKEDGSSFRFYIFIAFVISIFAYLAALFNRESVCNLLRTDHNEYFVQ
ncbi:unnamed protein product [Caenorhabditis nigoni]